MRPGLERWIERMHLPVAGLSVWLVATSSWLSMRRVVPAEPGFWNGSHLVIGALMAPLALVYLAGNLLGGRWREHFPWLAGNLAEPGRELRGLVRGRLPGAGGAGIYSLIQGLLLLALAAAAVTGLGWVLVDGSRTALVWRQWHVWSADVFAVLLVLHVLAAGAHLLDFLRD